MFMEDDGVVSNLAVRGVVEDNGEEGMDVVKDVVDKLFRVAELFHGDNTMPDKAMEDIFFDFLILCSQHYIEDSAWCYQFLQLQHGMRMKGSQWATLIDKLPT